MFAQQYQRGEAPWTSDAVSLGSSFDAMTHADDATKVVDELHSVATRAAASLARYDDVIAVSLVGSVARRDACQDSDVDLLVITRNHSRPSRLRRRIPPSLRTERLSLLGFSSERWHADVERGTLFLQHVALEGETLYDPERVLRAGLATIAQRPPDVAGEIQRQLRRLRLYREPKRLNGQHLFALSHLYSIGKATAIARCVELGEPIFVKEEALLRIAARHPRAAEAAEVITRLRPFYDLTRGREPSSLPFPATQAEDQIKRAIEAVERLASG